MAITIVGLRQICPLRIVVVTSGNLTAGGEINTDYVYFISSNHTLTMPTAVSNTCRYSIKNNHSSDVTILSTSSQTFDGTTTITVSPEDSIDLVSDSTNWRVI